MMQMFITATTIISLSNFNFVGWRQKLFALRDLLTCIRNEKQNETCSENELRLQFISLCAAAAVE